MEINPLLWCVLPTTIYFTITAIVGTILAVSYEEPDMMGVVFGGLIPLVLAVVGLTYSPVLTALADAYGLY